MSVAPTRQRERSAMSASLPTFFIIGAAKCGTTSLHHYLDQHPEIQMSAIKEPNFFLTPTDEVRSPTRRVTELAEYRRLFDARYAQRGEASTNYASHPRHAGVPERIKALVPQAKLLYLVRDPIARTISHHQMKVALQGERRSLAEAVAQELADPRSPYVCSTLYATQVELYLEHFPRERILVIDQARLSSERAQILDMIFDFLRVGPIGDAPGFGERLLEQTEWRTYPAGYMRLVDRTVVRALRWLPAGFRRNLRRSVDRLLWPPLPTPEVDDCLRAQLHARYAGEVARLRELTGEAFSSWSM